MPVVVDPCEFVKCRNVRLSEESLRRHYDVLLEIVKDFFDSMHNSGDKFLSGYRPRRITDIYYAVKISRKIGDKILDRLECCWKYIACERRSRNRVYCVPTIVGLVTLLKRPEYSKELLKRYEELKTAAMIANAFEIDANDLKALIDEVHNALLSDERFLKILVSFFNWDMGLTPQLAELFRKGIDAYVSKRGWGAGNMADKLRALLNFDPYARTMFDIFIYSQLIVGVAFYSISELKLLFVNALIDTLSVPADQLKRQ